MMMSDATRREKGRDIERDCWREEGLPKNEVKCMVERSREFAEKMCWLRMMMMIPASR